MHCNGFLIRLQHEMNSTASLLHFLHRQHLALDGLNRFWVVVSLCDNV